MLFMLATVLVDAVVRTHRRVDALVKRLGEKE